jgi:hypothetical protein
MRLLTALIAIGLLSTFLSSARAEDWCGFIDKDHSRVRCGFSSADECKQAVGDSKDAYCMPDPYFAALERARIRLAADRF